MFTINCKADLECGNLVAALMKELVPTILTL